MVMGVMVMVVVSHVTCWQCANDDTHIEPLMIAQRRGRRHVNKNLITPALPVHTQYIVREPVGAATIKPQSDHNQPQHRRDRHASLCSTNSHHATQPS